MSDRQQPTFNELVAKIVELSLSFTQYLGENKIPLPTFEAGSSTQYDGISAEGAEVHGKYANSWEYIENEGEGDEKGWRSRNFTTFMAYLKDIFRLEQIVNDCYNWEEAGDIHVVDLGGSGGHDSFVLARKYPKLRITVEDLPKVQSAFEANVPADLESRVTFLAHDFFQLQPVEADLYMIKLILHDWPDKECIQILQALRPSLRPGAKILFIDYVGKQDTVSKETQTDNTPNRTSSNGISNRSSENTNLQDPPLPRSIQQIGTSTDLRMMALFSTKERPRTAWKDIFRAADDRFDIARFEANPLSFFVVIEVVWRG
ncbi:hypothetical protein SAPIO_CDS6951 [Scedosporium apiospermum]|uniref:O-methyltransferase C-terminal domain-containing protein n=1 Tax=Pseudallescheria apiosperma TaxID=563466 RepID=A0A084G2S7_PSEDA|nr:uncharacterized protein SAPIO_CDS6951 [Scedosporium apiospermum]KEZ41639.1 hypothetical protein SAPIO_CDS6951 [Scedosporium apiospermum]